MKAVVFTRYGPPEVLQLNEVQKPTPKDTEVLIKVYATTVNRTDCGVLRGKPFIVRFFSGLTKPKNTILGNEFAGKIEAVGKNVKSFRVGEKVFGYNDENFGAQAQYLVLPQEGPLAIMPSGLTYEEAAPITEGAHYALNYLRKVQVQKGKKILIYGASGAIGTASVQLAKHFGAEITAVCATKNVDLVKSLGADKVIDYTREDFTKINNIFDVVFDAVGKSSFGKCKPLLKKRGIYISTEPGYMWQNAFLALSTPLLGGKKVLFPLPTISKEDVVFLKELIEEDKYKPVIDRRYSLEEIVDAYKYVEKGQKTGSVVITVGHSE